MGLKDHIKRGIPNLNISRPLFPEGDVNIENHLVLRYYRYSVTVAERDSDPRLGLVAAGAAAPPAAGRES
jgi:hypothetical protein